MLTVLRQRNFALLFWGQLLSSIGNWVLFITLPFYVYQLTGSALATSTIFLVSTLPRILLGSVVGVFVDRWDRKWILVIVDLLRAPLLLLLLLVRSPGELWVIYLVSGFETLGALFFVPARNALVARLVDEEQLITANALDSISDNVTRLLGPALGGLLYGVLGGITTVALVDGVSYFLSGLLILFIVVPSVHASSLKEIAPAQAKATTPPLLQIWQEWLSGLKLIGKQRSILGLFLVSGMTVLADLPFVILLAPLVSEVFGEGALALSWLLVTRGAGGLLGGLLVGQFGKFVPPQQLLGGGLAATGLLLLALVTFPFLLAALIFLGLMGVVAIFWSVPLSTLLQKKVSDTYRGRVLGAYSTTSALLSLVVTVLTGILGDQIGIIPVLIVSGLLYLVSAGVAFLVLRE